MIRLADKFGATALIDAIDLSSLNFAVASDPPGYFGFAMSHGLIYTARAALACFQYTYTIRPRSSAMTTSNIPRNGEMTGGPPHLVVDVPAEDFARIPAPVLIELLQAERDVLLYGSRCSELAKAVKVSSLSFRTQILKATDVLQICFLRITTARLRIWHSPASSTKSTASLAHLSASFATYAHVSNSTQKVFESESERKTIRQQPGISSREWICN